MPIQKLSKQVVTEAVYIPSPKGQEVKPAPCTLWDTETKGFGLRVYPSGKKSFTIHYRNTQGRWRFHSIGDASTMTVSQARDLARRKLYEASCGVDHCEEREKARQGMTVSAVCEQFMERYSEKQKRSYKDDKMRIKNYILPAFGSHRIDGLKRADVARLHSAIGKKNPHTANRVLALLSIIFRQAETWGFVQDGHPNPAKGIKKFPEKSRERFLSQEEAARLLQAVDQDPDIPFRLFVRLAFYTGARKNELLSLRWDDVDFEGKRVRFRFTKNGRDHYVRPAPDAWGLLERLREMKEPGCDFVFPGQASENELKPRGHVKDFRNPWFQAREAAGLCDVHLHDLRRTAASWLAQAGVSGPMLQKVLNHADLAIVETYARISGDDAAGAFSMLGEIMRGVEAKAQEKNKKVVPLKKPNHT